MNKYYLGFGLGLRPVHYETIVNEKPPVDWFEILSEDYLIPGGPHLEYLDQIREHYPMVMHGVSLSIGKKEPLNQDYLKAIKKLADRVKPRWISDHLCWTGVQGKNTHDLLPIPYTNESLQNIVDHVNQVQDFLGQAILLENVSSYVNFKPSEMTEWEFLSRVTEETNCLLLLDVNNIYVSAFNHGYDPNRFLEGIPVDSVRQFHLAGHSRFDDYIIDTHDHDIVDEVWSLYKAAVKRFGAISTMIERDDHIPPLQDLLKELAMARKIAETVLANKEACV